MQAEKVEFLHKKLSEEAAAHGRELMKRDAEREIVFDDLESLNDQYQQLTMAFELQTRKLSETQVSAVLARIIETQPLSFVEELKKNKKKRSDLLRGLSSFGVSFIGGSIRICMIQITV